MQLGRHQVEIVLRLHRHGGCVIRSPHGVRGTSRHPAACYTRPRLDRVPCPGALDRMVVRGLLTRTVATGGARTYHLTPRGAAVALELSTEVR